jgi:ABC-type polysaccharide/polyol phosphate transport system ATPase subunit
VSTAIEAVGLCKTYRRAPGGRATQALEDVSFAVARGEFFGVIGPNGGGKSTLLKLIAGIYPPTGGTVSVTGPLSPLIELGVGFNPDLDARANIRLNGTFLGLTRRELKANSDRILEFADLQDFAGEKLKNYSTGMQVRLAFAVAVEVHFDVLLVDEVFLVGDLAFQEKCTASFQRFRREGKTIVLVSHALPVIEASCDRALWLQAGRPRAIGLSADVVEQYARQVEPLADPAGTGAS